ncbi:alginate export family protein [Spongiibacter taiwanensis]|uniref:alginate export family protein n=1 Tax=Spongiibacter taiwanensis TaxID=1748242 RepID=UPI0020361065|nr:alginate export family protein [Spongiibacter taiwanensis]USA44382.1 alginate export family protein [Spongiibacter taiwanensis]
MSKLPTKLISASCVALAAMSSSNLMADAIADAITGGKAYGDLRLRYETVDQDTDAVDEAEALTLRTMIGYTTGSVEGFSATIEVEDSRIVAGGDAYSVPPTGFNTGEYSVIADPETTELDQGFIQYKNGIVTAKFGRQVLTYDGHRFVGHVGWRQDRQTFDGLTLAVTPTKELAINYAYITQRNRIFAEAADQDSKDHFINVAYTTPVGTLVGYSYMLENDFTGNDATLDTYGASFTGSAGGDVKFLYAAEFATQTFESGSTEYDADYMMLEGGVAVSGITVKLGYEVLGSDDGMYGFGTPLATLHKFNGWADMFIVPTEPSNSPDGGLVDTYLSIGGSLAGGSWAVVYHDFSADDDSTGPDAYGDEIDLVYSKKFGIYNAGIKYSAYSADEYAVDTDKLWLWVGLSF